MEIKKINGRKYLEIEESRLLARKVIGTYIGEDGNTYMKVKWFLCDKEVNLGSTAKPNKEIVSLKYESPQENPLSDILGGIFGGKK